MNQSELSPFECAREKVDTEEERNKGIKNSYNIQNRTKNESNLNKLNLSADKAALFVIASPPNSNYNIMNNGSPNYTKQDLAKISDAADT